MNVDELIAAGLYDPAAPDASDRLDLLQWLVDQGVSIHEIAAAQRHGSIYRAGLDAIVWPEGGGLTIAEVAAAANLPVATVRRARRLLGLADPGDEPICHRGEIDLFRSLGSAMALFGEEPALQFARVLGTSTAALAEAAISTFAVSVTRPLREAGASSLEYARRVREATMAFTASRAAIDIAMRLQFNDAIDRLTGGWGDAGASPPDELDFTIGFVDLAESTRLSIAEEAGEFAAAVIDFEEIAAVAAARHGTRLVKLIGDSAMIAAPLAENVADAALDIIDCVARDDRFRGAHGGIASGRVVARTGDYFGPPVNLAARLTDAAVTAEILCDETTAKALPDRVRPAGERRLQGLEAPLPVYVLVGAEGSASGAAVPRPKPTAS